MSGRRKMVKRLEIALFEMPRLCSEKAAAEGADSFAAGVEGQMEERKKAFEKGFAEGEKAGLEAGEKKAGELLTGLEEIVRGMKKMKEDLTRELEPQMTELAVTIARKIIRLEMTTRPDVIVQIVKEAVRRLDSDGPVMITMHPDLRELFSRFGSELTELNQQILYETDPAIPVHGPLVRSRKGEVETDIDMQLRNISEWMGQASGPH